MGILGIQMQVPLLMLQAFYQMSHLPSPDISSVILNNTIFLEVMATLGSRHRQKQEAQEESDYSISK